MQKFAISLQSKTQLSPDCWQFNFSKPADFSYLAGQYVLWEIPHPNPDNRGIKRLFTLASSPKENQLIFISKFFDPSSTYKQAMLAQEIKTINFISSPLGDFTLPQDKKTPLVFIASGVGCTPFRALLEEDNTRNITMFYSNQTSSNTPLLDYFQNQPIKLYPFLTRQELPGFGHGYFTQEIFTKHIPAPLNSNYYLCGGVKMVQATAKHLADMGVKITQIKRDIFTGYQEEG